MHLEKTSRVRARGALLVLLALALLLPAAAQQKKNAAPQPGTPAEQPAGNSTKGREVYNRNCAICHYPASAQKKVGPGLKEIYKRQFADGKKVDDSSMRMWIEKGGKQMPPYKNVLSRQELADVIAYLKTL